MSAAESSPATLMGARAGEGAGLSIPLERPAMLVFRWQGHHVDVVAIQHPTGLEFIARDILAALGHELGDYETDPDQTVPLAARAAARTWNADTIAGNFKPIADQPLVRDFLRWILKQSAVFDTIDTPAIPAPAADAEPEPFSVADAAKTLSRDPSISIGRDALFEWMREHGWIARDDNHWKPARDLLLLGYLAVLDRIVPAKGLYRQICITDTGMAALHHRLGGTAALDLHRTDTPTLED